MSNSAQIPIRIVVAGGNYAGLNAVKYLYASLLATPPNEPVNTAARNIHITMIDRRDGFIHYIGITRGLTEPDYGAQLWTPYSDASWLKHPSITFHQATVTEITANSVATITASGELSIIPFDYIIIALGEGRFAPIGMSSLTKSDFITRLDLTYQKIAVADSVAVIGGGAVGVELAADLKCDFPTKQVSLVHSRALPLQAIFKDEFRQGIVNTLCNSIGVDVVLGERVIQQTPASNDMLAAPDAEPDFIDATSDNVKLTLASGRTMCADYVIRCIGTRSKHLTPLINLPLGSFLDADGIRVKDTYQVDCAEYTHIYACGDITNISEVKLAGGAMYGGYIAARNISRCVLRGEGAELEDGERFPSKIMVLMGRNHFALQVGDEIWDTERTRQYITEDMGLKSCVDGVGFNGTPEYMGL